MNSTPPPPPPPDLTPPPDGFYHNNPTPMAPVAPVRGIGTAIIIAISFIMLSLAVITVMTPGVTDQARDFLAGTITEDEFLDGYGVIGAAQFAQSIATLVAAILTVMWMYRISKNVRAFGRHTTWPPLFAIFGWLLPPILVIIPSLMLRELWKASTPASAGAGEDWRRTPGFPMIWIWFFLYGVVQTVLVVVQSSTLVGGGLTGEAIDLAEAIAENGTISAVSSVTQILAGAAWIIIVRKLSDRHTEFIGQR